MEETKEAPKTRRLVLKLTMICPMELKVLFGWQESSVPDVDYNFSPRISLSAVCEIYLTVMLQPPTNNKIKLTNKFYQFYLPIYVTDVILKYC